MNRQPGGELFLAAGRTGHVDRPFEPRSQAEAVRLYAKALEARVRELEEALETIAYMGNNSMSAAALAMREVARLALVPANEETAE